jgi:hypothetical protein
VDVIMGQDGVSPRAIKETFDPPTEFSHPFMW